MKLAFNKLFLTLKAERELGLSKILLYARYKLVNISGYLRRQTPVEGYTQQEDLTFANTGIRFPWREDVAAVLHPGGGEILLRRSDKICAGQVRLFGRAPVDLQLTPAGELRHWTKYWTKYWTSSSSSS